MLSSTLTLCPCRFSWQKAEIESLLSGVSDISLPDRCNSLAEVFGLSGSATDGKLTGQDVADGLMRMRGDKDARLWLLKNIDRGGIGKTSPDRKKKGKTKGKNRKGAKRTGGGMGTGGGNMLPDIYGSNGGSRKYGNTGGRGQGGGGLFGGTTSLPPMDSEWTPAYFERLYNLNQQAAFKALFAESEISGLYM